MTFVDTLLGRVGLMRISKLEVVQALQYEPTDPKLIPFWGRAISANKRARFNGIYGILTTEGLNELWKIQRGVCPYSGKLITLQTAHLDHIKPLNNGGMNFYKVNYHKLENTIYLTIVK